MTPHPGTGAGPETRPETPPVNAPLSPRFAWIAAAAALAAGLLAFLSVAPPAPLGPGAPADRFSAGRAAVILARLLGDEAPHPAGSEANDRVRARITDALTEAGAEVEEQRRMSCRRSARASSVLCAPVANLYARLSGGEGPPLLLMAHHDSVGAGPGAGDDMHAVAVIIEITRALKAGSPLRSPVHALITDGEEDGLFGAHAFFADDPAAASIGAVINMEARGTAGPSLLFETGRKSAAFIEAYARHAPRPASNSLAQAIYDILPNDTDFSETKAAGGVGVNFAFVGRVQHYHTPLDSLANLSRATLQHQGDNVLAMTRALAGRDLAALPDGEAIYADILSRVLVRAPLGWAVPLAGAGALMLIAAASLWARGSTPHWGRLAAVVALGPATILACTGAVWAAFTIAARFGFGGHAPGYSDPLPLRLAFGAAAVAALLAIGGRLAGWIGLRGAIFGAWATFAATAVALALLAPGASINFTGPLLVAAGLILVTTLLRPRNDAALSWAALAAAIPALFWWTPLVRLLEDTLGFDPPFFFAVAAAFPAIAFLPVVAAARASRPTGARPRYGLELALAGAALAGALIAALMSAYSAQRPQRVNVEHLSDLRTGEAFWRIAPVGPPPAAMLSAAPSPPQRTPGLRGAYPSALSVPAGAAVPLPAPAVEIISDLSEGGRRTLLLGFPGLAGADRITLLIPAAAAPIAASIAGQRLEFDPDRPVDGRHLLTCHRAACRSVAIELGPAPQSAPQSAPTEDWLVSATSPGLPPGAEALLAARPPHTGPHQAGDVRHVVAAFSPPATP